MTYRLAGLRLPVPACSSLDWAVFTMSTPVIITICCVHTLCLAVILVMVLLLLCLMYGVTHHILPAEHASTEESGWIFMSLFMWAVVLV